MSTDLDDAGDRTWDQRKDERLRTEEPPWVRGMRVVDALMAAWDAAPKCEDCNQPCDAVDYRDFDGHGPKCPSGDPSCTLRVCDAQADHTTCETEDDRATRDAVEREQALREQAAEWAADDPIHPYEQEA